MAKPTELIVQTREELARRFPLCFRPKGALKLPLKVGIRADLYQRCEDIPHDLLRKALYDYVSGGSYQVPLLVTGAPRYDLDGNVCGRVEERHSAEALARLKGRPAVAFQRWIKEAGLDFDAMFGVKTTYPAEAVAATG